jgi:hypothetical protein
MKQTGSNHCLDPSTHHPMPYMKDKQFVLHSVIHWGLLLLLEIQKVILCVRAFFHMYPQLPGIAWADHDVGVQILHFQSQGLSLTRVYVENAPIQLRWSHQYN